MDLVVAVVLVVAMLASYVTWLAGRLDRLSSRCLATSAALEAQLARRAAAALALAAHGRESGLLDRVSSAALAGAAEAALEPSLRTTEAAQAERERCESALSRVLRATLPTPPTDDLTDPVTARSLADLTSSMAKTALARQFHNDAVRDWRAFRRRRLVRILHLAARRVPPTYAEFDDAVETTTR